MTSPIIIKQEFINPLLAEQITGSNRLYAPKITHYGEPIIVDERPLQHDFSKIVISRISSLQNKIQTTYKSNTLSVHSISIERFPENPRVAARGVGCENSKFIRKKWVIQKPIDLVGIVWLNSYNNLIPIDTSYEVMGGKLEFTNMNFSLMPQRGTLVIYPAGPNFITAISPLLIESLYQIKICMKLDAGWKYDISAYPSDWREWLKEYM